MALVALPSLEKLDPVDAWKPWQPDAKNPWNLKWAGHLYRRAAFGAGLRELREAVTRGLPATLDRLLDGEPKAEERMQFLTRTGEDWLIRHGKRATTQRTPVRSRARFVSIR